MKKVLTSLLALMLVCASVFALGSCGAPILRIPGEKGATGAQGPQGEKGEKGEDGKTPTITISEDGYWVINGEKTNYKAIGTDGKDGADGKDGTDGKDGVDGEKGDKGDTGEQGP